MQESRRGGGRVCGTVAAFRPLSLICLKKKKKLPNLGGGDLGEERLPLNVAELKY